MQNPLGSQRVTKYPYSGTYPNIDNFFDVMKISLLWGYIVFEKEKKIFIFDSIIICLSLVNTQQSMKKWMTVFGNIFFVKLKISFS